MIFKTLYKELSRMFKSFFKPPSVDTAVMRRERFSMVYAVSSFSLFVIYTYMLFKKMEDPVFMEKATLKPPPEAKQVKIEFDAKKLSFSTKNEENKDLDQEENSS